MEVLFGIMEGALFEKSVNAHCYKVSQNWLPRENRHVPTTKETPN
jgi:hypothetical protein